MMERRPWSKRVARQLPLRYRDVLPEATPSVGPSNVTLPDLPVPTPDPDCDSPAAPTVAPGIGSLRERIRLFFSTHRNQFALFRRYFQEGPPSHDPEENITLENLCDTESSAEVLPPGVPSNAYAPYPNRNAFRLGDWYWNGGPQKSQASFKDLLNIVSDPNFSPTDVQHVQWDRINETLADDDCWIDEDEGWETTTVSILVPFQPRRNAMSSPDAAPREYVVGDFHHRSVVGVIKEKLSNSRDNDHFHYDPFELNWQPGTSHPIRVHGELYTSDVFLEAHNALQNSPPEPGCNRPRNIVALMFYSDSTHLTSFGDASLWPLYLYFGNESKYRRCKPSSHLGNHIAYFRKVSHFNPVFCPSLTFEQLPDSFKDFAVKQVAGENVPHDVFMTFCHRELVHAQWKIIFDDEFIEAWKHGIIITCCDGLERRFYIRIFTHSGDYPEKYELAFSALNPC